MVGKIVSRQMHPACRQGVLPSPLTTFFAPWTYGSLAFRARR
jgi:hypothetical protein